MLTPTDLRTISMFADLREEQLEWLVAHMEERWIEVGESAFERDAVAEHMFVILEGAMQIYTFNGGHRRLFDTLRPGRVTGLLPYSRMTHFRGVGNVIERTRIAQIHKRCFKDMLYQVPEIGQPLIALMSDRVRASAKLDQQREKMMALGKLSAGLAHELNNPAAAVMRSTDAMHRRLEGLPALVARMARHGLQESQVCTADQIRIKAIERMHEVQLSVMEASEREDAIADWLDDHEVPDSWDRAPTFAESGLTPEDLDEVADCLPESAVADVIAWLEGSIASERILAEVTEAAKRISGLIQSIKEYSHMDRSPDKQATDLKQGIESTLTMLGHRLKQCNVNIERDYAADLPNVEAYTGELNQVWTNLIDNAIDAMGEGGCLRVRAFHAGATAFVQIIDNGRGIPEADQSRIFEPFFTTKDVGQGTGLGLDIVQRIVVQQHEGRIQVTSQPGKTVMEVQLPL